MKRTLIIGGVAGGATAATRLRRLDENREIIIFEKGEYISYANCGLPYYIGNVIQNRDSLLLQTPEAMKAKYNIDVKVLHEVTSIDSKNNSITILNKMTNDTFVETYDELIIATGSSPIKPVIEGIDAPNIFTLWSVPDTDKIKKYIDEKHPKSVAVIGGGFIGLEMAENLHALGLEVHIIEMQNQVMAPLDYDMVQLLHENMKENNIKLHLGNSVQSFQHFNKNTIIKLQNGENVNVDMVLLSIGVRPNSELARKADLLLNSRGGIVVNEFMQTSVSNIYAVGDVVEVNHYVTKEKTMIPLAGPANKEARIVANNLMGLDSTYDGSLGTSVVKVFDLNVATTGLNEKNLRDMGKIKDVDYHTVLIKTGSHAGYYPGATPLTIKVLFSPFGKIYGGQIIGVKGVDKHIDVLATVIRLNGSIHDLKKLELSYAPPFSSAKDPLNMVGFVAENILSGLVKFIEPFELDELIVNSNDYILLDVRQDIEHEAFAIPNSTLIPLNQLRNRINELDSTKKIIVYCAVGVRSYNAARILMQNGFGNVMTLSGGISFYQSLHN